MGVIACTLMTSGQIFRNVISEILFHYLHKKIYLYFSHSNVLVSQFLKVTQLHVRLHTVILGYENTYDHYVE